MLICLVACSHASADWSGAQQYVLRGAGQCEVDVLEVERGSHAAANRDVATELRPVPNGEAKAYGMEAIIAT